MHRKNSVRGERRGRAGSGAGLGNRAAGPSSGRATEPTLSDCKTSL